jgi:hypothetical protein
MNREMIRERGGSIIIIFGKLKISIMKRNRNRGGDNRIIEKRAREKKTIDTGGPGKGRGGINSYMIKGMIIMRRVKKIVLRFKLRKVREEEGGRKRRRGGGRITSMLNKIKITTNKCIHRIINNRHSRNERRIKNKITRLKIYIKKLKRFVSVRKRNVPP